MNWRTLRAILFFIFVCLFVVAIFLLWYSWIWSQSEEEGAFRFQRRELSSKYPYIGYRETAQFLIQERNRLGKFPETSDLRRYDPDLNRDVDNGRYWSNGDRVLAVWWGGDRTFDVDFEKLKADMIKYRSSPELEGNFIVGVHDGSRPEHRDLALHGDIILYLHFDDYDTSFTTLRDSEAASADHLLKAVETEEEK